MARFKRNNETIDKVKNVILAENITPEQRNAVEELVREYERNTYNDWSDRHDFYNDMVDDMINDCGFNERKLAERMANNHPTLQQTFMRMCANFIMRMAEKTYYDDRNRTSVEYAKAIMDNVGEEHFPFI